LGDESVSYELTVHEENRNETSQIAVRVLFFGAARDAVGQAEIMFSLSNPTNVAAAFEQVLHAFPALLRFGRSLLFAVNEEYARPEREVCAGDELAVFPSVSGGSQRDADPRTRRNICRRALRGHPKVR
jgi:molybdopterin converting factor small subunit